MVTGLLDADIIVWKSAALSQDVFDFGDGVPFRKANWPRMRGLAFSMIERWASAARCNDYVVVVSDRHEDCKSFRYTVSPDYHANRKFVVRPDLLMDLNWEIVKQFHAVYHPGLEGDDVLGILATNGDIDDPVIITEDKDLRTIPGKIFFPTRSQVALKVSKVGALRYWFAQSLIGDPSDNFKGAHGIGKIKASRILEGLKTEKQLWTACLQTFLEQGHTLEYGIQQVRLARILRAEDINEDWTQIRLWTPPGVDKEYYDLPKLQKPNEKMKAPL